MAGMIIAVPNKEMFQQATEILSGQDTLAQVLLTTSKTVVQDVSALGGEDFPVVVARGNHAKLLKAETPFTVVEIVLSGQEMALLVEAACAMTGKENTNVAFIGFPSMFSDPTPFAHVFKANIRIYTADGEPEIEAQVLEAIKEGADVIVGGEIAMKYANARGCQALFLSSTSESIYMALRTAKRVLYGIAMENRRSQEFMALLNYSFDGILKLDLNGVITLTNYMAESFFKKPARDLVGKNVLKLFDTLPEDPLEKALAAMENAYSLILRTHQEAYVANLAVLNLEGEMNGFILSMQAFNQINKLEEAVRTDRIGRGFVAHHTFKDIHYVSKPMVKALETATRYADFDLPVLISGPYGMEKHIWAEAIHNAGGRRKNPFVSINLAHLSPNAQQDALMRMQSDAQGRSVFENAHRGTLLIENVDLANSDSLMILIRVLSTGTLLKPDSRLPLPVDVRVICTCSKDLYAMTTDGSFPPALYYRLAQLDLHLPGLSAFPEDIPIMLAQELERLCRKYRRYVSISPKAQAVLHAHAWNGNIEEIASFMEKALILNKEREIGEELVTQLLEPYQQEVRQHTHPPAAPVLYNAEESRLKDALNQARGNRAECAELLGISKVTLWRRMKKYGMID